MSLVTFWLLTPYTPLNQPSFLQVCYRLCLPWFRISLIWNLSAGPLNVVVWIIASNLRTVRLGSQATRLDPSCTSFKVCAHTVNFPARQWAHSRHAQSGREYDCALFQLVILGPLSALSVLIVWVHIVLVCSIYLDSVANNENIASLPTRTQTCGKQ